MGETFTHWWNRNRHQFTKGHMTMEQAREEAKIYITDIADTDWVNMIMAKPSESDYIPRHAKVEVCPTCESEDENVRGIIPEQTNNRWGYTEKDCDNDDFHGSI